MLPVSHSAKLATSLWQKNNVLTFTYQLVRSYRYSHNFSRNEIILNLSQLDESYSGYDKAKVILSGNLDASTML